MEALLISILAVYCIATLVTESDGPFGVFYNLRHVKRLKALDCFLCLSVYLAAVMAVLTTDGLGQIIVHTFAISGGAIFLHRLREF